MNKKRERVQANLLKEGAMGVLSKRDGQGGYTNVRGGTKGEIKLRGTNLHIYVPSTL